MIRTSSSLLSFPVGLIAGASRFGCTARRTGRHLGNTPSPARNTWKKFKRLRNYIIVTEYRRILLIRRIKTITNLLIASLQSHNGTSWQFTTSAAMCTIAIIHRFLHRSPCYHHSRYRSCGPRLFLIDQLHYSSSNPTDWLVSVTITRRATIL